MGIFAPPSPVCWWLTSWDVLSAVSQNLTAPFWNIHGHSALTFQIICLSVTVPNLPKGNQKRDTRKNWDFSGENTHNINWNKTWVFSVNLHLSYKLGRSHVRVALSYVKLVLNAEDNCWKFLRFLNMMPPIIIFIFKVVLIFEFFSFLGFSSSLGFPNLFVVFLF